MSKKKEEEPLNKRIIKKVVREQGEFSKASIKQIMKLAEIPQEDKEKFSVKLSPGKADDSIFIELQLSNRPIANFLLEGNELSTIVDQQYHTASTGRYKSHNSYPITELESPSPDALKLIGISQAPKKGVNKIKEEKPEPPSLTNQEVLGIAKRNTPDISLKM